MSERILSSTTANCIRIVPIAGTVIGAIELTEGLIGIICCTTQLIFCHFGYIGQKTSHAQISEYQNYYTLILISGMTTFFLPVLGGVVVYAVIAQMKTAKKYTFFYSGEFTGAKIGNPTSQLHYALKNFVSAKEREEWLILASKKGKYRASWELGRFYEIKKDEINAEKYFLAAKQQDKKSKLGYEINITLGNLYHSQHRYGEAINCFLDAKLDQNRSLFVGGKENKKFSSDSTGNQYLKDSLLHFLDSMRNFYSDQKCHQNSEGNIDGFCSYIKKESEITLKAQNVMKYINLILAELKKNGSVDWNKVLDGEDFKNTKKLIFI